MTELEVTQSEYIKLLERTCNDMVVLANIMGYLGQDEDVRLGIDLRNKIKQLKYDD